MALIPDPKMADLPSDVRERLDALPPLTILGLLAHAPSVFDPVVSLGLAVLSRLELPDDLRVLVTLHVARELDAPYVEAQYLSSAPDQGVDPAKAQAVHDGRLGEAGLTETERAVLDFATEVLRSGAPSADMVATVRSRISDRQLVELLVVVGYYTLIGRVTTTCRLDPHDSLVPDLLDVLGRPEEVSDVRP